MKQLILILFSILTLYSCSKDPEQELIIDNKIAINAVYFTSDNPNEEKPDVLSTVFIYYNIDAVIFRKYAYMGSGIFTTSTDTIKPLNTDTIDVFGFASLEPKYSEKLITIAIESNYYKGRISLNSFKLNSLQPITFRLENKP